MNLLAWLFSRLRWHPAPVPPSPVPPVSPTPPTPGDDAAALLAAHNLARSARNLCLLALDPRLGTAAQGHAEYMARVGVLAHSGIGDGDPSSRVRASGFDFQSSGENIAMGYPNARAVVAAWLADTAHSANVLGDYTKVGFGHSGSYWCADYARA